MDYQLYDFRGNEMVRFINLEILNTLESFSNFGDVGAEICFKLSFKRVGH